MSIRIVDESEFALTRDEYERFQRDYHKAAAFTVDMPSFETWVRQHKRRDSDSDGEHR